MPKDVTYSICRNLRTGVGILSMLLLLCSPTQKVLSQQDVRDSLATRLKYMEKYGENVAQSQRYINLLIELGSAYRFVKLDSLYRLSNRALSLSKAANYPLGQCKALDKIGDYYSDSGDNIKAIEYYNKAFALADSIGKKDIKVNILNDLGVEYAYLGNYEYALKSYLHGIDIAKDTDNKLVLSMIYENIAGLYYSQKEYDEALEFYNEVKTLNEAMGNEVYIAETYSNLGLVYSNIGDYEQAMQHVNQSIGIFEKQGIYDWLAFAYEVKGEIYLAQKKYKWALHWFDQSNLLHKDLEDDRSRIDLLNGMAMAFLGLGEEVTSEEYATQGFDISKKINSLEGQRDCAETLYKISKNNKNFEQALAYHEIVQGLSDSLNRDENKKTLTLLKTQINYDKQKAALMAINDKSLARQRSYITITIIILIALLGTSIPLYLNQKKLRRLKQELQTNTASLKERESELDRVHKTKERLFSIIGHDLRGPIGALQGVLQLLATGQIAKREFSTYIPKLKSDVDHILFTLNNLLSWGNVQLNGTVPRPKMVSLNKLVENNVALLSELANKKSIKIINQMPENSFAFADENQIDVVFRNLLSNGIKFTQPNGLIALEAEEEIAHWKIKIRDTGIGIDEKMQQGLFEDQTSITTYGTNDEKGTGLGLPLCKEMVIKNNGSIGVESTPKKGSTFYFTIPKVTKRYQKAS